MHIAAMEVFTHARHAAIHSFLATSRAYLVNPERLSAAKALSLRPLSNDLSGTNVSIKPIRSGQPLVALISGR